MGSRIREERDIKGIAQKELALAVGVKQHTISQYESNTKRPSYEVLILLAKFFNVTVGQLLGTEE